MDDFRDRAVAADVNRRAPLEDVLLLGASLARPARRGRRRRRRHCRSARTSAGSTRRWHNGRRRRLRSRSRPRSRRDGALAFVQLVLLQRRHAAARDAQAVAVLVEILQSNVPRCLRAVLPVRLVIEVNRLLAFRTSSILELLHRKRPAGLGTPQRRAHVDVLVLGVAAVRDRVRVGFTIAFCVHLGLLFGREDDRLPQRRHAAAGRVLRRSEQLRVGGIQRLQEIAVGEVLRSAGSAFYEAEVNLAGSDGFRLCERGRARRRRHARARRAGLGAGRHDARCGRRGSGRSCWSGEGRRAHGDAAQPVQRAHEILASGDAVDVDDQASGGRQEFHVEPVQGDDVLGFARNGSRRGLARELGAALHGLSDVLGGHAGRLAEFTYDILQHRTREQPRRDIFRDVLPAAVASAHGDHVKRHRRRAGEAQDVKERASRGRRRSERARERGDRQAGQAKLGARVNVGLVPLRVGHGGPERRRSGLGIGRRCGPGNRRHDAPSQTIVVLRNHRRLDVLSRVQLIGHRHLRRQDRHARELVAPAAAASAADDEHAPALDHRDRRQPVGRHPAIQQRRGDRVALGELIEHSAAVGDPLQERELRRRRAQLGPDRSEPAGGGDARSGGRSDRCAERHALVAVRSDDERRRAGRRGARAVGPELRDRLSLTRDFLGRPQHVGRDREVVRSRRGRIAKGRRDVRRERRVHEVSRYHRRPQSLKAQAQGRRERGRRRAGTLGTFGDGEGIHLVRRAPGGRRHRESNRAVRLPEVRHRALSECGSDLDERCSDGVVAEHGDLAALRRSVRAPPFHPQPRRSDRDAR